MTGSRLPTVALSEHNRSLPGSIVISIGAYY